MPLNESDIAERYRSILNRISLAKEHYGNPSAQLIAVSKGHTSEHIRSLYRLGQRQFAESYINEATEKQLDLTHLDIEWHFIGRIQSNKTAYIANHFDWVHSIDKFKIAQRLNNQRPDSAPPLNIFLQINIDHEKSKGGILPESAFQLASQITTLPKLKLRGLMAIPHARDQFEKQRTSFSNLFAMQNNSEFSQLDLDCLSMGMSNDFEAAIAENATHLRIGSALFGNRPK